MVEGICIEHQMKAINVVYLLMYLILRKSEEVKKCVYNFFLFNPFLIVYISKNVVLRGLKFWMHLTKLHLKGTVLIILFWDLVFILF